MVKNHKTRVKLYKLQLEICLIQVSGGAKVQNVETKKSPVWEYFVPGDNCATCRLCQRLVKRSRGNTSNLIAHLRSTHYDQYEIMIEEDQRQKVETQHANSAVRYYYK